MQDIQEIFRHIQEMKRTQRSIRKEYADVLTQEAEYQTIVEEMKRLRERKKQIETKAQEAMGKRFEEFEELQDEIGTNQEMLSDVAMTTLMSGQTVAVTDEFENKYDPVFSVKFKKAE
jgi:predicted nuclease with TOPRIM domain